MQSECKALGQAAGSRHCPPALKLHTGSCLLGAQTMRHIHCHLRSPNAELRSRGKKMRLELKINWYSLNGTLNLLRPSPLQGIAKVLIKGEMMNIQDVF